jgi:hypothetical protein
LVSRLFFDIQKETSEGIKREIDSQGQVTKIPTTGTLVGTFTKEEILTICFAVS